MDFGTLTVSQFDALDDESWVTLPDSDATPPAVPSNIAAKAGDTIAYLTWTNPADDDFAAAKLRRGGTVIYTGTAGAYLDLGRVNGTAYSYTVSATDSTGNESAQSAAVAVTPGVPGSGSSGGLTTEQAQQLAAIASKVLGDDEPGGLTQSIVVRNAATNDPIEGAIIRYSQGGITRDTAKTDAGGTADITVPAGTYSRTVIAAGFDGSATSVAVSGDSTWAINLSAVATGGTANVSPGLAN